LPAASQAQVVNGVMNSVPTSIAFTMKCFVTVFASSIWPACLTVNYAMASHCPSERFGWMYSPLLCVVALMTSNVIPRLILVRRKNRVIVSSALEFPDHWV